MGIQVIHGECHLPGESRSPDVPKQIRSLLVHDYYSSEFPSGENQVFETEKHLLRSHGQEVSEFVRHSDEIRAQGSWGTVKGALATPWNPWASAALLREIERFKPDVVHAHNTFPLLSPGIFHAIGKRAARVLTLHNYRLFCPAAIPMRDGKVCTECLDKHSPMPAMIHGCYRSSRAATLPLAFSVGLHRALGTWSDQVDAYICLSEFQRGLMINAGLPSEKVHVKPNFYPGNPPVTAWAQRKPYVIFAGRLTAEKGLFSLLRAWQAWGAAAPELRLVGDGELRPELERMAAGLPVSFLGQVSAEQAQAQIAGARLLVLSSECFEGFPMVVREAFAFGTPAGVSDLGPLPTIVQHGKSGVVFQPSNPQSLLQEVRTAWETPGLLEQLGQGARAEFESQYTEEANFASLMDIYQQAIEVSRNG
ncbi:glycosyltransferase family 4 protein [Metapseudomonas boanensis]|uniref:Glycosyltransferase family 4 protein n=1 Tax=Metapseudomonas boanensis TaxID=2822138 RepID=A0ABS5XDM9_9GAMM|nr:glycosyltransferase family 4 protein [Pseudomonas boanensis]MBT8765791.1 glycosyltransferase family 4 protein [Pseudomonas boanensis]